MIGLKLTSALHRFLHAVTELFEGLLKIILWFLVGLSNRPRPTLAKLLRGLGANNARILSCVTSVSCYAGQLGTRIIQIKECFRHFEIQSKDYNAMKKYEKHSFVDKNLTKEGIQDMAMGLQQKKNDFEKDRKRNTCALCCIVFDVVAGFLFFIIIKHYTSSNKIASFIAEWRDETRDFLNELIEWLMGAPAGLKLNHEMTLFLGHFFQYHIYIWIGYLSLIEPYLLIIIQVITLSSCFGMSFMLSLTVDALTVLTFHSFCFYVYASKIYSLQLNALISLSRLFRGVKWNNFRKRIDSVSYNADQLAVGTILFTVILFLLPTTGIYYFVFASLRIPILALQAMLCSFVKALNTLPVHSIKEMILHPDQYIDGITFEIQSPKHSKNRAKCKEISAPVIDIGNDWKLVMKHHRISSTVLLKRHVYHFLPNLSSIHVFIKSFLTGVIIHSSS